MVSWPLRKGGLLLIGLAICFVTYAASEPRDTCCYNMFRKCSKLADVSGIKLNAEELTVDCYREFFRECPALTKIPVCRPRR